MLGDSASLLRLLHLADSALPIGATAHSFGLETLVQDGDVDLPLLHRWFEDYLVETGAVDAHFCRRAYGLASCAPANISEDENGHPPRVGRASSPTWLAEATSEAAGQIARPAIFPASSNGGSAAAPVTYDVLVAGWRAANQELSALRTARESRAASHALGGRLLRLLADLEPQPLWQQLLAALDVDSHYACVFGLGGAVLGLVEEDVVLSLLRQNIAGLMSACQRLMPLGQGRAGQLLWRLQEAITACAAASHQQPYSFAALLDAGSMRHPLRQVRLFIS